MNLHDYLLENIIITDGAMGTYYGELYPTDTELVERVNLTSPDRIQGIHKAYLKAGARLIRTNSFAVNSNFFDDENERLEVIRTSYQNAMSAVKDFADQSADSLSEIKNIFIAADLGPAFDLQLQDEELVLTEYKKNIDAFLEQGASIFLFETQTDFDLIRNLSSYIKEQKSEAYVITTFSIDKTGYTKAGMKLNRMMRLVAKIPEIGAYGLNCGMDAVHMRDAVQAMSFYTEKPIFLLPNAGYPYILRGKPIYAKNEGYWSEVVASMVASGANGLGGCCGTTPDHIAALTRFLEYHDLKAVTKLIRPIEEDTERTFSSFYNKLERGEKAFIVELDPPFDVDANKVVEGAAKLKEHNVDLLTLSDSPMGRTRMDSSVLGSLVQNQVGIQVMPHIACRDRNTIGLRGLMLGDYYAGLRHFLLITGDPVPQQDRSVATPVFDYNSIKFMSLIKEMNQDVFAQDRVVYGGALNYHGANPDAIVKRMEQKMEQGCAYFLTQPIYSDEDIERIKYLKEKTGAKICAGIMPLVSYKNAVFMANQMPGIKIPEGIVNAYTPEMTREEAEDTAVRISTEIAEKLWDIADAYYFMTPFNRVGLICDIIENIRKSL